MSEIPSNVIITQDVSSTLNGYLQEHNYSNVGVIVDNNTLLHCYPLIQGALPENHVLIEISAGEEQKNLNTCSAIWHELTEKAFDRKSLIINLGGGVIGDMGGFCAATFKRGIDFINIPTTLLAQVDASVGGKLGIDFEGFKNHIGVFKDPKAVLISSEFLQTLDKRELRSGFAEVVKHALIADDANFNELILHDLEHQDWEYIIPHNVAIKRKIVESDPTEKGYRKILNFGHTIGHAIETYFLNNNHKLLHGEAIAIGMICEAWLSIKYGNLQELEFHIISDYIIKTFACNEIDEVYFDEIAALARQDKKNEANKIFASLLECTGKCLYNIEISADDIKEALLHYNNYLEQYAIK